MPSDRSDSPFLSPFVTPEWLAAHLDDPKVGIVDGSWHLPTTGRVGRAEYETAHLPGAVFFDIDLVADRTRDLPHMMPSRGAFAEAVGALGLSPDMTIVVYDGAGLFSAPRVAFMFRAFGAKDVRILAGGFPRWQREGRAVTAERSVSVPRVFAADDPSAFIAAINDVAAASRTNALQIVDARGASRFTGAAPEPRPGLPSGHIPGSLNLPFDTVVRDGEIVSEAEIRALAASRGIDLSRPIVTTCGSGVTAAVIALAFAQIGAPPRALYDGAYTEWASDPARPIETGASPAP